MNIWKDKSGKWIDAKEFVSRFKNGVEGITPFQQTKSQLFFQYIMIVGILCGIVASAFVLKKLWWVEIILVAALGNTVVGTIGIYQKYLILKGLEDIMNGDSDLDIGLVNNVINNVKGGQDEIKKYE